MKSRTNENLIKVMKKTKFKIGEQVKIVTTDGLRGYPFVLRKTFSLQYFYHASSRTKSKILHAVVIASEKGLIILLKGRITRLEKGSRRRGFLWFYRKCICRYEGIGD